jgi:hypothetical protein
MQFLLYVIVMKLLRELELEWFILKKVGVKMIDTLVFNTFQTSTGEDNGIELFF